MSPDEPEERVARLLGEVGAERPEVPPDVAAGLEATLADLVRERGADATRSPVRGHPRRRRFLLAAAAAVIVVGAGGITVAALNGRSVDSSASRAGAAAADRQRPTGRESGIPLESKGGGSKDVPTAGLPVVRAGHIAADVQTLLRRDVRSPRATKRQGAIPLVDCTTPKGAAPRSTRTVLYGDTAASLVLGPRQDAQRVAELWSCSGRTRLARVRVDVP